MTDSKLCRLDSWKDSSKQCQTEHWMCLCGVSFPACIAVCYKRTAHLAWLVWHVSTVSWAAVLSAVCRVWWESVCHQGLYFWQECVCETTVLCTADKDKTIQPLRMIHLSRFSEAVWEEGVCRVETDECDS